MEMEMEMINLIRKLNQSLKKLRKQKS